MSMGHINTQDRILLLRSTSSSSWSQRLHLLPAHIFRFILTVLMMGRPDAWGFKAMLIAAKFSFLCAIILEQTFKWKPRNMKLFQIFMSASVVWMAANGEVHSQTPVSATTVITRILTEQDNRNELSRLKDGIATELASPRVTDPQVRQMLTESQTVLNEMLDQRIGDHAGKLVEFAKWMKAMGVQQVPLLTAEGTLTPAQQLILDNSLAGEYISLTSIIHWILGKHLEINQGATEPEKLEALLQLYLNFHNILERVSYIADDYLLHAPQWIQGRYPQLTADQKRLFLKDVNEVRQTRSSGPGPDEEAPTPLTPAQQASYDAAYQFIVANTPP